ncbi:Threonylcarbamoyl-AMP synthase [Buchnera aphidicola (Tetraneura ulmi)]|uniref:Sua5/YciO/YrdC/YwlC family protein n=1 Tax=Buchnera aphidicola TaxID=9 RepID=UPI003464E2D6
MKRKCYFFKYYSLNTCIEKLFLKEVITYPTESVFAFGCDPDSYLSTLKLLKIKKRIKNKGFVLVASTYNQIEPYILEKKISFIKKKILFFHWPGNTTFLLPARSTVPEWITGDSSFVAFRISRHYLIQRLCNGFGKPIISTSANISNHPPCRNKKELYTQFGSKIIFLDGKLGLYSKPSKILNLITGEIVRNG